MKPDDLYPRGPRKVPEDFSDPSASYRRNVVILTISLAVFLLVYCAIVIGTGYLTYYLAVTPLGRTKHWHPIVNGVGALIMGMLFLFFLKGLFKGQRADRGMYLEIKRDQYPKLFEFIDKLCDEIGAPDPARVYVSPDVNAAVIYDTSLLNLIVPPKKHLLIGLGLVNSVNLSEFKATLAHEFGHFSQGSLALGRYVYVINQILRDIVYGRDRWDDLVNYCCRFDVRVSFPAWGLKGITWALRQVLEQIFKGITLIDLALSRQMEFNADDVAVSVSGSDALVNLLFKLDFANESLGQAARDLDTASAHDMFTRDLFHHQTAAAAWIRKMRKDPQLGLPPKLADKPDDPDDLPLMLFDPEKEDSGTPAMWSTHPPNHEREANAKRLYLRAPLDVRAPWLLFDDLEGLKRKVTMRFYLHGLEKKSKMTLSEPDEVQQFIDDEHAETSYDPKYHGLYDERFLNPGSLPTDSGEPEPTWQVKRINDFLDEWPWHDLESRMKEHRELRQEMHFLDGLKSGELMLKGRTFTLRDNEYTKRDIKWLHSQVEEEVADEDKRIAKLDRDVMCAHFFAAQKLAAKQALPERWPGELLQRYSFHLSVQKLLRTLLEDEHRMIGLLNYLQGKHEVQSGDFQEIVGILRDVARSLRHCVRDADDLFAPAMMNVASGTQLTKLIWERDADLPRLEKNPSTIKYEWIADYLKKQTTAQQRLRRIHFKSLGNILGMQEQIAETWRAAIAKMQAAPKQPVAAETGKEPRKVHSPEWGRDDRDS